MGDSKKRWLPALGRVEVEKAEIERGRLRAEAVRGDEAEALSAFILAGKKDGDARHQQCLRELEDDGVDERAKIGLRVEVAAEADQRLAVVEPLGIEDAIDPGLNPVLERVEEQAGDDDRGDEPPGAEAGEPRVDNLRRDGDDDEVEADERSRDERVGDAALEDEVDIHQAVAHDRPAEGQRKEDERERRKLDQRAGGVLVQQHRRDDIEQRERQNREQRSAREPLELLTLQRLMLAPVTEPEDTRRR